MDPRVRLINQTLSVASVQAIVTDSVLCFRQILYGVWQNDHHMLDLTGDILDFLQKKIEEIGCILVEIMLV